MTDPEVKVVQYARVESYAAMIRGGDSFSTIDIDIVYEQHRPVRFIINHKTEIGADQLRVLLEVLKRVGIDLGGGKK
jgi:hypothetical protein